MADTTHPIDSSLVPFPVNGADSVSELLALKVG